MPQFGQLHIERNLTNYSLKYDNPEFINEKLFPPVPVQKESDKYLVYNLANFNLYETLRANGSESAQIDWGFTEANYFCEQHSLKDIITDRDRSNADKPLTLDIDTLELVTDGVMLKKEFNAATIATTPSNYITANTEALTGGAQWDQYSTSNPLTQIKQMQLSVFEASRKYTNVLVLPYPVALALAYHPDILELVKYTNSGLLQGLTGTAIEGLLPAKIFGMEVVIAGAAYNSANPGQTAALADIWGTNVVAAYVEQAPKLKSISYGKTFRTEKFVRKWRQEERQGDWVEYNDIYALALTASSTGFLLQTAIS